MKLTELDFKTDVEFWPLFCMSCGKNLGHIESIKSLSYFSPRNWMPVCNKCFSEKIGKPTTEVQHPFQK